MGERLLIVEDEETLRDSLQRVFRREGYEVEAVGDAESALSNLDDRIYDLIVMDIILPAMNGIELLKRCKQQNPNQLVIVMTAFASLETAVEALRGGAYDYIVKPLVHEEIKQTVRNALREQSLAKENLILKKQIDEKYDFGHIVGQSRAISLLLAEVRKIADSRSNVLLLGETGTGKELFARAIHNSSSRREKPFLPINCSAIPDNLLESELFGHAKNAFTGAVTAKRGLFEEADGGTVFLDEIGELNLQLQAKLLRVLDDKEIRPIGGVQSRAVDIRFIAATNRDIAKASKTGVFREDLYYRINVVTLWLPPLRDRREDILPLANHFLNRCGQEIGKEMLHLHKEVSDLLMRYNWPGNVRELRNIIERAVLLAESDIVLPKHLPEGLRIPVDKNELSFPEKALSIEEYTKEFILHYQDRYPEQQLAGMLGITRKSLWEKRKKWDLRRHSSNG